jgi:PAS domain S-box-containing protein
MTDAAGAALHSAPSAAPAYPTRRASSRSLLLVFSVLVIVMLVGMAAALMVYLRATALRDADHQMTNLGAVLAEQTARTVQSVELMIGVMDERLRTFVRDDADPAVVHAWLGGRVAGLPQIKQVTVIGPDGRVRFSSRYYPAPDVWLGDRPHFMHHRDARSGEQLAIDAVHSRLTGAWMIVVSRRLERADGSFAGVIDVDLDPDYFETVYKSATVTEGAAITLLRADTTVLVRYPAEGGVPVGRSLPDDAVARVNAAIAAGAAVHAPGRLTGEPRIFAPRRVQGYPLIVVPSISEVVILAKWRRQAGFIGAAAVAATVAIILLMILLRASEARSRRQAAVLQDAVDAMSDGLVLYDANDRLVLCNQRFRELRPRDPISYQPGIGFEEMMRIAIKGGELVVPKDEDPEAWIRRRIEQHRSAAGVIMRAAGGRILRISERRTSDGGIVAVHADITELKRAEAEVEAAQARMADWAGASNDWFWETDAAHRFTFISEGVEKAIGLEASTLIGRRIDSARASDEETAKWREHLDTLGARRAFRDFVVGGMTRAGQRYFVSVSGRPFVDAGGSFAGYRGTGRDVTAQIEAEHELERHAEIFSTLIENLPVGVSLVGPDLRFVAFNQPFLEIYELEADMLRIGDPFEKFIRYHAQRGEYGPGDIDDLMRPVVERALTPQPTQFERRRPSGQVIEVRRVPLPGGGFVTTYIDVTTARQREFDLEDTRARLERQAQELNEARIEAERARSAADAASRAKSLFLANMSHELRTPLNAILGFSEVTREAMMGPLDARYRDYAREIHASGQYLLRLINDVLDTSKIEVDRMELHEEPVDLADVVGECQRLLRERAEERQLSVTADLPAGMPMLVADRLRIKQILLNLLSNALKFTPAGGQVAVTARLPGDGGILVEIADTGIGMRAEDIPVALQPFRQVENPLTRHYEGTGLGLPLAKALVELHDGRLTIDSEPGRGTTVHIWLPPRCLRPRSTEPGRVTAD